LLRREMTACVAVLVMSMPPFRLHADDKTMLIELEGRAQAYVTRLSACDAIVVGGLSDGAASTGRRRHAGLHCRYVVLGTPSHVGEVRARCPRAWSGCQVRMTEAGTDGTHE